MLNVKRSVAKDSWKNLLKKQLKKKNQKGKKDLLMWRLKEKTKGTERERVENRNL